MNRPPAIRRLPRRRWPTNARALARFLVGKVLVRELGGRRLVGRIVETEAYPIGDPTGYAFRGRTERNAPLFLERGHAYVRLMYGASYGLNCSAEKEGAGAAVLLRALEPLVGLETMTRRRRGAKLADLARGPGRLTQALAIDSRFDGADLCNGPVLWIGSLSARRVRIGVTTRIGLSRDQHRRLRFYELDSAFVSGPKRLLRGPRVRSGRASRR